MTYLLSQKKVHTFLGLLITLGQVLNQCVFLTLCEGQSPNRSSTLNSRNMHSIPSTLQKHLCYLTDTMALPFFSFAHFNLYCVCAGAQNFWNFHLPCELDVSRTSHFLCFAHLEGIFKAVIICKSQERVLPLPSTFSYFKLSSHCWPSAGKGHECQLIHSDKRLSCMSPGQSHDRWHPCPTYVILCIIFNPEFTRTTQRRKLRELRWGGSLVHTHKKPPWGLPPTIACN